MKYYTIKRKRNLNTLTGILCLLLIAIAMLGGEINEYKRNHTQPMVKPMVDSFSRSDNNLAVVHVDNGEETSGGSISDNSTLTVSQMVEKMVKKYAPANKQSYYLYLSHCLLYKESNHGSNLGRGDGGMASGIFQMWNETYLRFRKQMMTKGLVDHIGSRDNQEDAIETSVWAFVNGRDVEWGPVKRQECPTK
jgi:hypothetical protein